MGGATDRQPAGAQPARRRRLDLSSLGRVVLDGRLIKLAVVVALLLNQLWAYPASMVVLGLFVVYQVYRYTFAPSIGLILLTAFDLVVLWLIWHEYGQVRAARAGRAAGEAPPG